MNDTYKIGIDIGTHAIKIVMTEPSKTDAPCNILHTLIAPSHGLRHGYIVDPEKASKSLINAIKKAEKKFKAPITSARFSINGIGLKSQYVRTSIDEIKGGEIQEKHVEEVVQRSENLFVAKYPNKKILHIIPVKYRVDDRDVLGTPIGMYGSSIEIKVIFITILEHHYDAFTTIIEQTNVQIIDIIAAPIADAASSLNYKQKSQGCMIANIGAETTALSTFENGIITSLDILPIGSNDITNDIALGLQIPLTEAEKIKLSKNSDYPKRKLDEIIQARLTDILELTDKHLLKIKKNRLLPAGVVFTGGGSHIQNLNEYAKQELKLPSENVHLSKKPDKSKRSNRVANELSTAYGLCIAESGRQGFSQKISFKKILGTAKNWLQEIMP